MSQLLIFAKQLYDPQNQMISKINHYFHTSYLQLGIEGTYVCKSKKTCLPNSKCSGKYKTVLWEQICDGKRHCPCGDDELHCGTLM